MKPTFWMTSAAITPLAVMVAISAPAHADDVAGYLQAMHGFGVMGAGQDIHTDADAVSVGRQACQLLRAGQGARAVEETLLNSYSNYANPTAEDVIQQAHDHLCPDAPPLNWAGSR